MRTLDPGDAARIELLRAELRLPAVKPVWAALAVQADKEGWPAAAFWPLWPNMRLPSVLGAASNAILPKPGSRPARPSTPLTSRPCPWSARPRSWRFRRRRLA